MKKFFVYPMIAVITATSAIVALVLIKTIKKTYGAKTNDENTTKHHEKPAILHKIHEVSKKSTRDIKPLIAHITKNFKPKSTIHNK